MSDDVLLGFAFPAAGSFGAFYTGAMNEFISYMQQQRKRNILLRAFTGTSAGAVNAAIYAHHVNQGTLDKAPDAARAFWVQAAKLRPALLNPAVNAFMAASWPNIPDDILASAEFCLRNMKSSPYLSQLSGLVREQIGNGEALGRGPCKVTISTARKKEDESWEPVLFHSEDITPDHVAASGALEIFGSHNVKGQPLYDGAYTPQNPPMASITKQKITDIFVLTTQPPAQAGLPLTSYQQKLHTTVMHDVIDNFYDDKSRKVHIHGLHFIPPSGWNPSARMNPDPTLINKLQQEGHKMMRDWLEVNGDCLGKKSTYIKTAQRQHRPAKISSPVTDMMMMPWHMLAQSMGVSSLTI